MQYTKAAIQAFLSGNFNGAFGQYVISYFDRRSLVPSHRYERGLNAEEDSPGSSGASKKEKLFWENESLECRLKIREWKGIHTEILSQEEEVIEPRDFEFLWEESNRQIHPNDLRNFITSSFKLGFDAVIHKNVRSARPKEWVDLFSFFDTSLTDPKRKRVMEECFSTELVMRYAIVGNSSMAKFYLGKAYDNFLVTWSQLPLSATGARLRSLQGLQQLTEVGEYLKIHPYTAIDFGAKLKKGLDAWESLAELADSQLQIWSERYPARGDPVEIWDAVVSNRAYFCIQLVEGLSRKLDEVSLHTVSPEITSSRRASLEIIQSKVHSHITELYRRAALATASGGNTAAAKSFIFAADTYFKATCQPQHNSAPVDIALVKISVQHSQVSSDRKEKLKKAYQALANIPSNPKDPVLIYKLKTLHARVTKELLALGVPKNEVVSEEGLYRDAAIAFQSCLSGTANLATAEPKFVKKAAKAYVKYANFLQDRMSDEKAKETSRAIHQENGLVDRLSKEFMKNIFEAMRLDSPLARAKFPAVLELIGEVDRKSSLRHLFLKQTTGLCDQKGHLQELLPCRCRDDSDRRRPLPSWMFIQWIPQLLGGLRDTKQGDLVYPILSRIARDFPQALIYPFNITKQTLRDNPLGFPERARDQIHNLNEALGNELISKFVEALDGLAFPQSKWRDTADTIDKLLQSGLEQDRQQAVARYQSFHSQCLVGQRPLILAEIGNFNKKFTQDFAQQFSVRLDVDGKIGAKLLTITSKQFAEIKSVMSDKMKLNNLPKGPGLLVDYSEWLTKFERHQAETGQTIEIPGQYQGLKCPQPEFHVRIVNFDQNVLTMSSIRRPRRITIHGSDERDYNFLIKGGEDLRIDQRVEQMFWAMNAVFKSHPQCVRNQLSVRTYEVVPLTLFVGMLEWVPGTLPVKQMVNDQLQKERKSGLFENLYGMYVDFMFEATGLDRKLPENNIQKINQRYLTEAKEDIVLKNFDAVRHHVPSQLLLKQVRGLCATPEAFLVLRKRFAASFGVLNICSYILGIGDRHLENFLVDVSSGTFVAIDFGMVFGAGLGLQIPELIPFRFTRLFQGMFAPLDSEEFLMKRYMCIAMEALQQRKDFLLSIMNVFIKDPSADWEDQSKSRSSQHFSGGAQASSGSNESSGSRDRNIVAFSSSENKISIVRKKLERYHPVSITLEEIGQADPKVTIAQKRNVSMKDNCIRYVKGTQAKNKRARVNLGICPDVQTQVECLIDFASDPNILGRAWVGWAPYF